MRYTSTTYEETNGGNTKRVWFNVNMENEDEIFRFTEALIRVLVKICDFDEDELEEEWMNMSFDSDIGEPDFDGIQEFWNQYAGRVLEELWSIDQDAFEISDFVEEEVEKKPYAGSGDDGFAAAMFPVKEGQRDVSIMRQFKKGFEVLDKELATIPSIYKALTEFKFKVGSEDFNGDYVITIAFDKDVIDIQNVYWYLKGEKDKVKMTSNWSKEKAAAVIINGRLEYDDVYLMESLVGTEMYITNATPTKEYLQESKNLQESFTPGRCWDDWYNIISKRIPFDDNPDEMRKALDTIDKIHAETGAFKNAGETDKHIIDECCETLAGASDYELYEAFEEMCEYFGW